MQQTDSELQSSHGLMQVAYELAGGVRTAYYRAGQGEPLILLHGGGAGADSWCNWRACFGAFAQQFDTIAIDMIGFGLTDKPDPSEYQYTQAGRTTHIIHMIETLGVGPVHVIGNSMGGLTAIGVAVERPDLVRGLVLMGSAAVRTEFSPSLLAIANYDFSVEGMRRIVASLTHEGFPVDESLVQYRHRVANEPRSKLAYSAIQGWIKQRGGLYCEESYIRRITVPTLVVSGKLDKVVPVTSAYQLLELIPQAWGSIFPHCGHWAMIERPDAFSRIAIDFLKSVGAGH